MKKYKAFIFLIIIIVFTLKTNAQERMPEVASGKIERIENFKSKYISSRNIDIWLPEGYSESRDYSVLYMHDGQMLFDSSLTWNRQAWDIDDISTSLFLSGEIKEFIVVGIWNGGETRHIDYFPQKVFESLSDQEKDSVSDQLIRSGRINRSFLPVSDNYLSFLVKELKAFVDNNYSVLTNQENTFIAGSSMGGLISIYAICEYPEIFHGAACLSTHWPGTFTLENNPIPSSFIDYLMKSLPNPENHKIYFDYGDQTLDALYPEIQREIDKVMSSKGFDENNWITKSFPGHDHSELSWRKRLDIPLRFLFRKSSD